jgi:hypothetical protein
MTGPSCGDLYHGPALSALDKAVQDAADMSLISRTCLRKMRHKKNSGRGRGVCLGKLRYNYVVGCYIHCVPVSRGIHIIVLA